MTRLLANSMVCLLLLAATSMCHAQKSEPNYDEAKVPPYDLPDPLVSADGTRIVDAQGWTQKRRPEILALFESQVYGKSPGKPEQIDFETLERSDNALGGIAVRKQVRILFINNGRRAKMDLLIYLPMKAPRPVPIFLGLNFDGNHAIDADPEILLSTAWMRTNEEKGVVDNRATEKSRGVSASRWPVRSILARGYGVATAYYGDLDPDDDKGFADGVPPLFYKEGQTAPGADEWGSIGAWAWGLSRVMDYFEADKAIDEKRVAVLGHSRLGKTSLWAGAIDPRFAIVISNNSGCGGAALSKRVFGETVGTINKRFVDWFCDNFNRYNDNEAELPVDQHMLIALIAPRPVYVASAVEDRWADPYGEFLGAKHADAVYKLLGTEGLPSGEFPELDNPVMGTIGYHIRTGGHDVKEYDWQRYMDFADKHFHVHTVK